MNITTISYSESHEQFSEYGLKLWKKAGIEAELSEGDDPGKSYDELERIVKGKLASNQPPDSVPVSQIDKRVETIIGDIELCAAIHDINAVGVQVGLVAYESAASSDPRIKAAYDLKMIQLKQK